MTEKLFTGTLRINQPTIFLMYFPVFVSRSEAAPFAARDDVNVVNWATVDSRGTRFKYGLLSDP